MTFFCRHNDRGRPKRCFAIDVGVSLYQYLHKVYHTVFTSHMQRGPTIRCRNARVIVLSEHKLNLPYISSINSGSKASGFFRLAGRTCLRLAGSIRFRVTGSNGFQIAIRRGGKSP